MKFGHRVIGKVERYDEKGRGVFELEGVKRGGYQEGAGTVAIPFTAVGDEVEAIFIKRDRGIKMAKLEKLVSPGADRTAAPCPHAGTCGGCLWQHLKYEAQLELKQKTINKAFELAGHEERIESVTPSVEQFHHRNRMDYAIGWHGEIGLKEYDSWNRYVDLKTCLLLNDGVGEFLQQVREWMAAADLQPWDAKFHHGDIRYVVVREGKFTKQRMIMIVVKDDTRITAEHKADLAKRLDTHATTILLGEQNTITDLSYVQKFETLKGNPFLEEIVNDVHYRIHPNSFFQTNSHMAGTLQNVVADFVGTPKKLLDLYCGLGFFGIFLAKKHPEMKVAGYELDAEAIKLATHNATANGVADRCEFTSGPAEDLSWKEIEAGVVILDPPRSGLHPKVLTTILEKAPQEIVYVSCNFRRLVEELKLLKPMYRVEKMTAIDLFPHTPHVEVVVKLVKI